VLDEEFEDTKGPYIEEEPATQLPKVQKDKQRSTKHKYRVTQTPLKPGMNSGARKGR